MPSHKAAMDDLDHPVLLRRDHLVVRGEAEAAAEDIRAHVLAGTGDIGVGAAATVALGRDKGVGAVDGLHMHGLPDGTALGIEGGQGVQDLMRRALPALVGVEVILFAADHGCHGVLIDDQAGKPIVRLRLFCVEGIHFNGQVGKTGPVPLVDRLLLSDVLVEMRQLAPDDARDDVAHAVVVADLLMLIPGGGLPALGGPLAGLVGILLAVSQEHTTGAAGDDLVAIEGDAVIVAQGPRFDPLAVQPVLGPEGFRRVFHDQGAMLVTDGLDLLRLAGSAIEMSHHHQPGIRIKLKSFLQRLRTHVPGVILRVDKHRFSVLIGNGVDAGVEGHIGAEDPMALKGARVGPRLTIQLFTGQLRGQMKSRRAAGQSHGVLAAHIGRHLFLDLVDVGADGADPVGPDGVVDPVLLLPVHGGGSEPDLGRERLYPREPGIVAKTAHTCSPKWIIYLCPMGHILCCIMRISWRLSPFQLGLRIGWGPLHRLDGRWRPYPSASPE